MNKLVKLALFVMLSFVISCGGGNSNDSTNRGTIDGGSSNGGGGNGSYTGNYMPDEWDNFAEFSAGEEDNRIENQDDDGEYLSLVYTDVTYAEVATYANNLLADGFIKIFDSSNDSSNIDNAGFYIKVINGETHFVRFVYTPYNHRYDLTVGTYYVDNISDKWAVFPAFTSSGIIMNSIESSDNKGYEYLKQHYVLLSQADIDSYINKLLAAGFFRTPKNSYEKVANGKRYRFSVDNRSSEQYLNFVMFDDVPNQTVKPERIVLSPMVQQGKEVTYTLDYSPTGSNATCTGTKEMLLNATQPLLAGATTWKTNIKSYSIGVEGGTLILEKVIPPVYMICDNEEIPVMFFNYGESYY